MNARPTNKGIAYTNPKTLPYGERPRAAYMRPLRTDRKRQANGQGRCLPQSASGGRERPPYKTRETGKFPINPAWGIPLPGGIYASPTNTRYRVHKPENVALQYRFLVATAFGLCVGAAYMPPAETVCYHPLPGWFGVCFCLVGRAISPAEHYKIFKIIIGAAGSRPRPTK